jgi:hypothetical protein
MNETKTIKVSEVVFRKDLYPRIEHNQAKALEYSENLEHLPPIEVNQHNELIDGFHRWTAHKLKGVDEIAATITETKSDNHLLILAIEKNATHGLQMAVKDKEKMARRFYLDESSWSSFSSTASDRAAIKKEIAKMLKVSASKLSDWLSDIDQKAREERREVIKNLWLKCHTAEEIGDAVGLTKVQAGEEVSKVFSALEKSSKVTFSEEDFQPPIYNVWCFGKKTNETSHFGNTEQRITENLLWLYTQPGDIVVDPFGGGGSTLDVCKVRGRRCWISDRKPKAGLEDKLRTLDICADLPPLNKRWSDVSLVYLDPPYWRQAQGQYSDDVEDLANMPLEQFTESMAGIIKRFAAKMSQGVIAMIIQPTQWKAEPKGSFADHVFDICKAVSSVKNITVENRISCPYSTEQCTPQMVEWSKENKRPLVLSRELVIWRISK